MFGRLSLLSRVAVSDSLALTTSHVHVSSNCHSALLCRTMATSSKVKLSIAEHPLAFFLPGITVESANKASELLQENHEKHHIFFNKSGFHNHIAHHLLTTYALGVSPSI